MVRKQKVKVYLEDLYCDNCNTKMEQEPFVLTSYSPIYTYKCPNCGEIQTSRNSYPRTVYESED